MNANIAEQQAQGSLRQRVNPREFFPMVCPLGCRMLEAQGCVLIYSKALSVCMAPSGPPVIVSCMHGRNGDLCFLKSEMTLH